MRRGCMDGARGAQLVSGRRNPYPASPRSLPRRSHEEEVTVRRGILPAVAAVGAFAAVAITAGLAGAKPTPAFSNTRLTVPLTQSFPGVVSNTTGDSEPSVSIGANGHIVVGGLSW